MPRLYPESIESIERKDNWIWIEGGNAWAIDGRQTKQWKNWRAQKHPVDRQCFTSSHTQQFESTKPVVSIRNSQAPAQSCHVWEGCQQFACQISSWDWSDKTCCIWKHDMSESEEWLTISHSSMNVTSKTFWLIDCFHMLYLDLDWLFLLCQNHAIWMRSHLPSRFRVSLLKPYSLCNEKPRTAFKKNDFIPYGKLRSNGPVLSLQCIVISMFPAWREKWNLAGLAGTPTKQMFLTSQLKPPPLQAESNPTQWNFHRQTPQHFSTWGDVPQVPNAIVCGLATLRCCPNWALSPTAQLNQIESNEC